jgi:hypothetical protein
MTAPDASSTCALTSSPAGSLRSTSLPQRAPVVVEQQPAPARGGAQAQRARVHGQRTGGEPHVVVGADPGGLAVAHDVLGGRRQQAVAAVVPAPAPGRAHLIREARVRVVDLAAIGAGCVGQTVRMAELVHHGLVRLRVGERRAQRDLRARHQQPGLWRQTEHAAVAAVRIAVGGRLHEPVVVRALRGRVAGALQHQLVEQVVPGVLVQRVDAAVPRQRDLHRLVQRELADAQALGERSVLGSAQAARIRQIASVEGQRRRTGLQVVRALGVAAVEQGVVCVYRGRVVCIVPRKGLAGVLRRKGLGTSCIGATCVR